MAAPVGYLKGEQRLEKDPDRRVREAIELVFRKFAELGSVRQTLSWFLEHGLTLPVQTPHQEQRWKSPSYGMLYCMLTHPAYAGAYAYGKTEQVTHYDDGQPRKAVRRKSRDQWLVLIPNAHEGYVSWEQFERIRQTISQNLPQRAQAGAVQRGQGLLAGLLHCRRCGHKLLVHYTGKHHNALRYNCCRGWLDSAQPRCIGFGGQAVDEAVATRAAARGAACGDRGRADGALRSRRTSVTRCWRPWSAISRRPATAPGAPRSSTTRPTRRTVWSPTNWSAAGTRRCSGCASWSCRSNSIAMRRSPASCPRRSSFARSGKRSGAAVERSPSRHALEEAHRAHLDSRCHRRRGCRGRARSSWSFTGTAGCIPNCACRGRRRGQNATHTAKETVEAVRVLARICSDQLIAGILNRNALLTGRGNRWTQERVTALRSYHDISCYQPEQRSAEGWMNLTEAAKLLGVSSRTLRLAAERGEIEAQHPLAVGPWVFNRSALQTPAAAGLVERVRRTRRHPAVPADEQADFEFSST